MSNSNDVKFQVMWNRLISVVEEQASALVRTAFSTSVREAGDLSAGVYTPDGRMMAQAVTGTPGHVNTMSESVLHFLAKIPRQTMYEGDCYVTNDPWKGTGHLHDITMVAPSFKNGRLIAFFACTAHVVDIGGRGFGADAKSVYEEGLLIPIMRFAVRGQINQDLIDFVRNNVREANKVVGDFYSLAACNEVGHRRLTDMMNESGLDSLEALAQFIFSRSKDATLKRIKQMIPTGRWSNELFVDGYDQPIRLAVQLTGSERSVHIDFSGTDAISQWGINCPFNYSKAYASYAIKCVIAPDIPNNHASLEPIIVTSPINILNAVHPAPVALRHVMGHMIPDLIFGALTKALPDQIQAEGASALWNIHMSVRPSKGNTGERAEVLMFNSGGTGARPHLDGMSATAFPSGVHTMQVEATEHTGPIVVWRKELREGSGGDGCQRGGLGQIIEISPAKGHEFDFSAMFDRCQHPAAGRNGGGFGAAGIVQLDDGTILKQKGWQHVPEGRRLILKAPGGGGFGSPDERCAEAIKSDIASGYVVKCSDS